MNTAYILKIAITLLEIFWQTWKSPLRCDPVLDKILTVIVSDIFHRILLIIDSGPKYFSGKFLSGSEYSLATLIYPP